MYHNNNPFVQDENKFNDFLTSKYGSIAKPFIAWRTSLDEKQREFATNRLVQSMLIIYKGTMNLEKTCSIMPKQLDKEHFFNTLNEQISLNFPKNVESKKTQVKSFNMDEDHVKKFIFEKYGAVATPFVHWRETLNDNEKKLATPRLIQNMIHLHLGNIPLENVASLLPRNLDKVHFQDTVQEQLSNLLPQSKFKATKITTLRQQHSTSSEHKNTTKIN